MKKFLAVAIVVMALTCLVAVPAFSAPKLQVKDTGGTNNVLDVEDTGFVGINTGATTPAANLHIIGDSSNNTIYVDRFGLSPGMLVRRANGTSSAPTQILAGQQLFGFGVRPWLTSGYATTSLGNFTFAAAENLSTTAGGTYFTIGTTPTGSTTVAERVRVAANGFVGIGTNNPQYLLDVNGQIRVQTTVYSSSRSLKDNIVDLNSSEAMGALDGLTPVKYNYRNDPAAAHIGFIAEDVPNLVAQKNRDAIDPMDIVAVLTKVVQEQNRTITELSDKMKKLERQVERMKAKDMLGSLDPSAASLGN
jgi:hypothetical protein